jgi:hypothetical protein
MYQKFGYRLIGEEPFGPMTVQQFVKLLTNSPE